MSKIFISGLRDGDNLDDVYLAADKQLRANKNGNLYVQIELRDRTGGISARMWNAGDHVFRTFENGDFLHAEGKVQIFQGTLQIILNHIEKVEPRRSNSPTSCRTPSTTSASCTEKLRTYLLRARQPAPAGARPKCFLMDDAFIRGFTRLPGRGEAAPRLRRRAARTHRHDDGHRRRELCRSTPAWTATCC